MGESRRYDGIVIGAGHNGLILASYLARAGLNLLLLERRLQPGGGLSTSDRVTLPGFHHNLHSINHFAITRAPWWRDLGLAERVTYIKPEVEFAQPHRDGSALIVAPDLEATLRSFARFSTHDARALASLNPSAELWEEHILLPERFTEPLPDAERRALWGTSPLGAEFIAHTDRMPLDVVKGYFSDDRIRALLLFKLSIFGTINFETVFDRSPTGTFVRALAVKNTYELCKGGSWNLARGLMETYAAAGGHYRNQAEVARITLEGGRATGVELSSGERYAAGFVASTLGPHLTFNDWVGEGQLPDTLRDRVRAFKYTSWGLWGAHWALKEPPRYLAAATEPLVARAQKFHLGEETLEDVDAQHEAMVRGTFLRKPQFGGGSLSVLDPSQAPRGRHTAYAWQPVPALQEGTVPDIEAERDEHARRTLEVWREYAPNMTPDNVLAAVTYTPWQYTQEFPNMVGGDIFMGAFTGSQVMDNHFGYRSEIPGLYMAGSSVHPGGAISGGPGYIAAGVIARDLELRRWWPSIRLEEHAEALRQAALTAPVAVP
jgi:phytoene dehydrogenase-like protein